MNADTAVTAVTGAPSLPSYEDALAFVREHAGDARLSSGELLADHAAGTAMIVGKLNVDPPAVLAAIRQPARLMVGDRDAVVTMEETRDAARSLAQGQLAVLPATAHPFEQVRLPLLATLLRELFDAAE